MTPIPQNAKSPRQAQLPLITDFRQDWTYKEFILYIEERHRKKIRPVNYRSECDIPQDCIYPRRDASYHISTKTTAPKGRFYVKYAVPDSPQRTAASLP